MGGGRYPGGGLSVNGHVSRFHRLREPELHMHMDRIDMCLPRVGTTGCDPASTFSFLQKQMALTSRRPLRPMSHLVRFQFKPIRVGLVWTLACRTIVCSLGSQCALVITSTWP